MPIAERSRQRPWHSDWFLSEDDFLGELSPGIDLWHAFGDAQWSVPYEGPWTLHGAITIFTVPRDDSSVCARV
jgi:hypothetical protein